MLVPLSLNHVRASLLSKPHFFKWNGFSWIVGSRISSLIQRGEWSNVLQFRWCTDKPPKQISHSLFAKFLSSLSHIESPFLKKKKIQVNEHPLKPISINPYSLSTSLNSYIWARPQLLPPFFSAPLKITLKSPKHNQGKLFCELSCQSKSYDSCLF